MIIEKSKLSNECKYQVLVVDDEPAAAKMIEKIINTRSDDFFVKGVVCSGTEALDFIKSTPIDLVISDVRMPKMDGISLVTKLKENNSQIESIIVSGYQDFEYVQGALRANAADYILKPITPTKIITSLETVEKILDFNFYQRRNKYLKKMVLGNNNYDMEDFKRVFWADKYCVAVVRKNGLTARFKGNASKEIFSEQQEQMIVYGRDEQEMLFIYPEELMYTDFQSIMNCQYNKLEEKNSFLTMVICDESVGQSKLADTVFDIYETLDKNIVIGESKKLRLGDKHKNKESAQLSLQMKKISLQISTNNVVKLEEEIKNLMAIMKENKNTQFFVESTVRHILYELKNNDMLENWDGYWIDDIFGEVTSMDDVCSNFLEVININKKKVSVDCLCDKETLYSDITKYMKKNLKDNLSVQMICKKNGISQATLNRLFRQYGETSFKGYLTKLRIEEATKIIENVPGISIKDVALQVGYNDHFYFSRVYKSFTGKNPSENLI